MAPTPLTCIFGIPVLTAGVCSCTCQREYFYTQGVPGVYVDATVAVALSFGVVQTPDCSHAFSTGLTHTPSSGETSSILNVYAAGLAVAFQRDARTGLGANDYNVTLIGQGIVRAYNNRGKCVDGSCSSAPREAAAALPKLDYADTTLRTTYPHKFKADVDDVHTIDNSNGQPFISEVCPTTRMLLDVDLAHNMRVNCSACAAPVVAPYSNVLNAGLWTTANTLVASGGARTYTNNQLEDSDPTQLIYNARSEFQFLEVMRLDRKIDCGASPLPNFYSNEGGNDLPFLTNRVDPQAANAATESPLYYTRFQPAPEIPSTGNGVSDVRSVKRFLFSTGDPVVQNIINQRVACQSNNNNACDFANPVACSNACTDTFDTVRFQLLDFRAMNQFDAYPESGVDCCIGSACQKVNIGTPRAPVWVLPKHEYRDAFKMYYHLTYQGPIQSYDYHADCLANQCCSGVV